MLYALRHLRLVRSLSLPLIACVLLSQAWPTGTWAADCNISDSIRELTQTLDRMGAEAHAHKAADELDVALSRVLTDRDVNSAIKAIEIPGLAPRPAIDASQVQSSTSSTTLVRGSPQYKAPAIKVPSMIKPKPEFLQRRVLESHRRERIKMPALEKPEPLKRERIEMQPLEKPYETELPVVRFKTPAPPPPLNIGRAQTKTAIRQGLDLNTDTDAVIHDIFKDSNARTSKRMLTDLMDELDPVKRNATLTQSERSVASQRLRQLISEVEAVPEVASSHKAFLRKAKALRDILRTPAESEIGGIRVSKIGAPLEYWRTTATRESHPQLYSYQRPQPGAKLLHPNRSDNIPGSPGNVHFYGSGFGGRIYTKEMMASHGPHGKPLFETTPFKEGELPLPPDFEADKVLIAKALPGTTRENVTDATLGTLLIKGERATLLAVAGERNVYLTHPPVPIDVAKNAQSRLKWAKDNCYRVIKIARPPADEAEFELALTRMRREVVVRHFEKVFNEVSWTDGAKIWKEPLPTDKALAYRNVAIEDLLQDRVSEEVNRDLVRYFSSSCDAPCKRGIEGRFATEGLGTPAQVSLKQAIELQLYQTIFDGAVEFMATNDLLIAGNWSRLSNYHAHAKPLMDEFYSGVSLSRLREINEQLLKEGFPPAQDLAKEIYALKKKYPKWADAFDDANFVMPYESLTDKNSLFIVNDVNGGKNIANGLPFDR